MKKRITVIGAFLSFLPMSQTLLIGTGAFLTSSAVMISLPERAQAYEYESASGYNRAGLMEFRDGNYSAAIYYYTKAIEIDPNNLIAHYNRGLSRRNVGDYNGAISDFIRVIKLDPDDVGAYFNLGILKGIQEKYDGSIYYFTRAIKLDPDNAKYYFNRGLAKKLAGYFSRALSDFNKVIELNPVDYYFLGIVYLNIGEAKAEIGDFEGACDNWKKALYLDIDWPSDKAKEIDLVLMKYC